MKHKKECKNNSTKTSNGARESNELWLQGQSTVKVNWLIWLLIVCVLIRKCRTRESSAICEDCWLTSPTSQPSARGTSSNFCWFFHEAQQTHWRSFVPSQSPRRRNSPKMKKKKSQPSKAANYPHVVHKRKNFFLDCFFVLSFVSSFAVCIFVHKTCEIFFRRQRSVHNQENVE